MSTSACGISTLYFFYNILERDEIMFDIAIAFMKQLVDLIIPCIAIYILFAFIGSLLFGKNS